MNSICADTDWSFTADGGLPQPKGCKDTFRDAKVCDNLDTDEIDDHRT